MATLIGEKLLGKGLPKVSSSSSLLEKSNKQSVVEHNVKEWKTSFLNSSKILSPSYERLVSINEKNQQSTFFQLFLSDIDGIFPKFANNEANCKIQVNVSFFDLSYRTFFGRTWHGPSKPSYGKKPLKYNEGVFFHTSIRDPYILIVIEVIGVLYSKQVSCGWTAFRPFGAKDSSSKSGLSQRIGIYSGTPRALLFMDDTFEQNEYLKPITGCYVNYSFSATKIPELAKRYLPENILVGRYDKIGGISEQNQIDRLKLSPIMSCVIEELYITLNPNLATFENELCKLFADDRSYWDQLQVDPSTLEISERRLKIGVHNGWGYLNDPYVVQLGIDNVKSKTVSSHTLNRRLSSKIPLKPSINNDNKNIDTENSRLMMRNSVILNDLYEDPSCSIVFTIEYVINVPINLSVLSTNKRKNAIDNKKQKETHYIIVRWAVWSPFTNVNNEAEYNVEINIIGGSQAINPENVLTYKVPDTRMQDEISSKTAPGKLQFVYKKGTQLKLPSEDYFSIGKSTSMQADLNKIQKPFTVQASDQVDLVPAKSLTDIRSQQNLIATQFSQYTSQMRDSQKIVGVFGGNLELYPIKNQPVHYPVLALEPGQIGGRTVSRAAYARLQAAKFPPILDRFEKLAEVIDENSFISFDLNKEETDPLICNEISIQFLAFSRMFVPDLNKFLERPKTVFFTFQFYRFPEIKTPKLVLDNLIEDYSLDPQSVPFILRYTDSENSKGKPGYMIKYNLDPSILKFGEKRQFLQYVAHQAIYIDVWDGDSLHLIGTCTLQLKELLRQGKEAVQATYELDILSTDYDDDSSVNTGHTLKEGTPYPYDSHIKLQGKLHIRIGNVGLPTFEVNPNEIMNSVTPAPPLPVSRIVASKSSLSSTGDRLLNRKLDEASSKGFITHNLAKAGHMTDTFKEIHTALVSESNAHKSNMSDLPTDPLRKRKLKRMELIRRMEDTESVPPQLLNNHRRVIEDRYKDLKIMEYYRQQTKHDQIINKLNKFITTEYCIYPSFSAVEFLEFVITNPFNDAHTITIISYDSDVQVVTDAKEWRHLRLLHNMYGEIEDNMFNRETLDMNGMKCPQLFLRPKETVHVPLKFQTFKADNTVDIDSRQHPALRTSSDKSSVKFENSAHKSDNFKKCQIDFRAQDGNPIAVLILNVEQQPHIVNQTFRFNVAENTFLKKTIRLPNTSKALASATTQMFGGHIHIEGTMDNGLSQLFVRASDPNVICESKAVNFGEPHDVFIKASCPPSPTVKKFHLAIFADQFLSVPLQIWQVYVHSIQRIDMQCIQGQTSRTSIILKGSQSSRLAKIYPSSPEELQAIPDNEFMLPAGAVQEINIGVRPLKTGTKYYYLNVVDVEMSLLIRNWLVYVHSKPPVVSKAFELNLPVSTNVNLTNTTNKRVSYTNPYSTEKVFLLATNRDDLMTFKETRMKFMANETKTLALKFFPNTRPGFVEILVFINNENDSNEETFAIRATYANLLNQSTNY